MGNTDCLRHLCVCETKKAKLCLFERKKYLILRIYEFIKRDYKIVISKCILIFCDDVLYGFWILAIEVFYVTGSPGLDTTSEVTRSSCESITKPKIICFSIAIRYIYFSLLFVMFPHSISAEEEKKSNLIPSVNLLHSKRKGIFIHPSAMYRNSTQLTSISTPFLSRNLSG